MESFLFPELESKAVKRSKVNFLNDIVPYLYLEIILIL